MEEAIRVLYAVVIVIVAAAAIFTGIDVYLSLKTARGGKPGYFNIIYKPEYDTKFYRAHLVGKVDRLDNKVLYVVEIHPRGRGQSACVDRPGGRATRSVFTGERKIL